MRLLDALNHGALEVPDSLKKLEKELKKEWTAIEKQKTKQREGRAAQSADDGILASRLGSLGGLPAYAPSSNLQMSVSNVNINYNIGMNAQSMGHPSPAKREAVSGSNCKGEVAPKKDEYNRGAPRDELPKPSRSTLSLGLLNGSYKIDAQTINTRNSGMMLCLEGTSIWGEFQFGDMEGIFFMPDRPWQVCYRGEGGCSFEWRGVHQTTGQTYYGPGCRGEMRFLGNGSVEGTFYRIIPYSYGELFDCDFWGFRTSGKNETRASRTAGSMRKEYMEIGL